MVATRIACLDASFLFAVGGRPKTEEGKALFENHRKVCSCVDDLAEVFGDQRISVMTADRAVLERDFGPCDFPEVEQNPVDIGLIEVLAILAKHGKV